MDFPPFDAKPSGIPHHRWGSPQAKKIGQDALRQLIRQGWNKPAKKK